MRRTRTRAEGRSLPRVPDGQVLDRSVAGRSAADVDLELLFDQVAAVRQLARDVERKPDPDRVYDVSIRWGTLLSGRLARLTYYADRGELSPPEQARYEQLQDDLRDVTPAAVRLGLHPPDVAVRESTPAE